MPEPEPISVHGLVGYDSVPVLASLPSFGVKKAFAPADGLTHRPHLILTLYAMANLARKLRQCNTPREIQ